MGDRVPIFEYRCQSCQQTFERIRRYDDESPVECPTCKQEARKLVSSFAARTGGASSGGYAGPAPSAPSCAPGGG